jgi:calcium-dependent protein kinase
LTAGQVLEHPWFKTDKAKKNNKIQINVQHLRNFVKASKLQKAVLTCMASQLSESEIMDLRKIFLELDQNGDGTLTFDELNEGKTVLFVIIS